MNKIIGYILLFIGLLLIILPLYQSYNIFSGKSVPPEIFKNQKMSPTNQVNNPLDLQQQLQKAMSNVLPTDSINKTLNLISWILLMWIFIFGGSKIAGLGILLIK